MPPKSSPRISYDAWIESTKRKMKRRGNALKKVDEAIKAYEAAIKDFYANATPYDFKRMVSGHNEALTYKEKRLLTEIKIALDAWKRSEGPSWQKCERNRSGSITKLDRQLTEVLPTYGSTGLAPPRPEFADNARLGILYFLSNSTTRGMPTDPVPLLKDTAFAGAGVHHLVTIAQEYSPLEIAKSVPGNDRSPTSLANKVNNIGALNELYNAVVGWLREKVGSSDLLSGAADFVISNLIPQIPRIIGEIFAGVMSQLGNVIGIGKNIYKAISAYSTYRHRSELEAGILSGHPQQIISSVYEQIKSTMKEAGKDILISGLKMGLDFATVGAGTVLNAFVSVIEFVYKIYARIRDTFKLRAVLSEARIKDDKWRDADAFQKWFLTAITKLPIISCYCITMPMTGSYFGFLAATSTNNESFSFEQLERNNRMFNDVKRRAFGYIADNDIKLTSSNKMVAQSLSVAQGGTITVGNMDNENAAKKGLKRFVKSVSSELGVNGVETTGKNLLYGWF
jgi:hypothetical protein